MTSRLKHTFGLAVCLACLAWTSWASFESKAATIVIDSVRTDDEWRQLLKNLVPDSAAAAEIVPELVAIMRDANSEPVLRQQVAMMLGRIGQSAKQAVPVLIEIAKEPMSANRKWALKSLGLFRDVAKEAVSHFETQLLDAQHDIDDRVSIADVFGRIGSARAMQALARTLLAEGRLPASERTGHAELRKAIVDSLAYSGPASLSALPALIRTLEDDDPDVRQKTCAAIGRLGPQADRSVDLLADRLVLDESPAVQDEAALALSKMGSGAVPLLDRLLVSKVEELQWRAAKSLGQMPTFAKQSLPKLRTKLQGESNVVRIHVIEAVWRIDGNSGEAEERLIAELSVDDRQHRAHAVRLLVDFKSFSETTKARLAKLSQSRTPTGQAAAQVIKKRALGNAQ